MSIGLLSLLLLLSSVNIASARDLTTKEINIVVSILEVFNVGSSKIESIRKILEPGIIPQVPYLPKPTEPIPCSSGGKFNRLNGNLCKLKNPNTDVVSPYKGAEA